MTARLFYFTWDGRFDKLRVTVDPVGLQDWNCPLTMLYWVAGHAMHGDRHKFEDPRRDDQIDFISSGRWEGTLCRHPFVLLDTLFMPKSEVPAARKRKTRDEVYVQALQAANPGIMGARHVQPAGWVQWFEIPGAVIGGGGAVQQEPANPRAPGQPVDE